MEKRTGGARGPQGGTAWAPADRAATDFADSLYLVRMKEGGKGEGCVGRWRREL